MTCVTITYPDAQYFRTGDPVRDLPCEVYCGGDGVSEVANFDNQQVA